MVSFLPCDYTCENLAIGIDFDPDKIKRRFCFSSCWTVIFLFNFF